MGKLYKEENGMYGVLVGTDISTAIKEAIRIAFYLQPHSVSFDFNGVMVTVEPDSRQDLIERDFSRAMRGYIEKNVGPHPSPELSEEEKANDARIKAEYDLKCQRRRDELEAEARAARTKLEVRLADAPQMEFSDEAAWKQCCKNNQDGYGAGIITFTERWARLMQLEMQDGKELEEVANSTSSEADIEGITGFMYGAAVSTLARCWKHGDRLRRWHNLDSQIGNEGEKANENGGTLNPALLVIGKK